ncbi:MAG: hypothetical protein MUP85_01645 [Candidatus Lokiarchaeota archaeon]|nr:hypothetical protein [Candidatus Lokiarchaeota archaeon]
MKNLIKIAIIMIFTAILFTGYSNEDNPLAPNNPGTGGGEIDPIVIKTPTKLLSRDCGIHHSLFKL